MSQRSLMRIGPGDDCSTPPDGRVPATSVVNLASSFAAVSSPAWLLPLLMREETSARNPRRRALDEKNAADSLTVPPSASRPRGRQRSTSGSSRNFLHATLHMAYLERSQAWSAMRTMHSRGRGARGAPHMNLGETHMGRETRKSNAVFG